MDENAYRILVAKSKENRPPGRPRCMWYNNIKLNLKEVG
jgi:hypothetical protein